MSAPKPPAKGTREYNRHGLTPAKRALRTWGERAIDGRTRQGKALAAWKGALLEDLGGPEHVSAQQLTVLEMAARTKILLDGIDAWLFEQPSLVNKSKRALFAVVRERQALADSLARYMAQLGMERRARVVSLADYVIEKEETAG